MAVAEPMVIRVDLHPDAARELVMNVAEERDRARDTAVELENLLAAREQSLGFIHDAVTDAGWGCSCEFTGPGIACLRCQVLAAATVPMSPAELDLYMAQLASELEA